MGLEGEEQPKERDCWRIAHRPPLHLTCYEAVELKHRVFMSLCLLASGQILKYIDKATRIEKALQGPKPSWFYSKTNVNHLSFLLVLCKQVFCCMAEGTQWAFCTDWNISVTSDSCEVLHRGWILVLSLTLTFFWLYLWQSSIFQIFQLKWNKTPKWIEMTLCNGSGWLTTINK